MVEPGSLGRFIRGFIRGCICRCIPGSLWRSIRGFIKGSIRGCIRLGTLRVHPVEQLQVYTGGIM